MLIRSYAHERHAPIDITLSVAELTALFCSLASVIYAAAQIEPSPVATLILSGAPVLGVILWLQKDAPRTGVGAVQDWGYFLLLAWPVVIPWYAFKTQGRSGWRLAAGLFALIWSPHISWIVATYAVWLVEALR